MNAKSKYVSAATKLLTKRKDLYTAYEDLERQKKKFADDLNEASEKEQEIRDRDLKIQEELIQCCKKLQDNELQKQRAEKKLADEIEFKEKREEEIQSLNNELERLKVQAKKSERKVNSLKKYDEFLNLVVQNNQEMFSDITEILRRYKTLKNTKDKMEARCNQKEEHIKKIEFDLINYEKKKSDEILRLKDDLSHLTEMQDKLEQEKNNIIQDIEGNSKNASQENALIGRIFMAIDNLYNRCLDTNAKFKEKDEKKGPGRANAGKPGPEKKNNEEAGAKDKEDEIEKILLDGKVYWRNDAEVGWVWESSGLCD